MGMQWHELKPYFGKTLHQLVADVSKFPQTYDTTDYHVLVTTLDLIGYPKKLPIEDTDRN